jgi:putative membrane protein
LKNHLRRVGLEAELEKYLSGEEIDQLEKVDNIPNALLDLLHSKLRFCLEKGWIDTIQQSRIDTTIANLSDSMGKCERIKNTVFPIQYTSFTLLSVAVFALLFPLSIVKQEGIYVVPITFTVVFVFLLISRIASYMQNPFENMKSDIPMSSIARTIEIDLLQQVGAENIPEKIVVKEGVLM